MSLIEKCTCGKPVDSRFHSRKVQGIDVSQCNFCLTMHQVVDMTPKQMQEFYEGDYHTTFQDEDKTTQGNYIKRYSTDLDVAHLRLDAYEKRLTSKNTRLLDIGAGNGAFISTATIRGFESHGLEPGRNASNIKSDYLVQKSIEDCTREDFIFPEERFGIVCMHDVIEHLVDPRAVLQKISDEFLEKDGLLIVDLPHYFSKFGKHHWWPIQHLWFWDEEKAIQMFNWAGYAVKEVTMPVQTKLVFYLNREKAVSA